MGFDMGTSGIKCVAVELGTGKSYSVYSEWKLLHPKNGYAEFDCEDLWKHMVDSMKMLKKTYDMDLGRVCSIGFCALCPGVIAVDQSGKEITPCIIFMDDRSGREADDIKSRIKSTESFEILGNQIMAGATSNTTMLWLKRNCPEIYRQTKYFLHMPSWAGFRLTGKVRMDASNASGTGLYDIHEQAWSSGMVKLSELDAEKLPALAESVSCLGGVNNEEIIALGIRRGTVVSCGAGDTVSALLGFHIQAGEAMLSLGTSHVLYTVTDKDTFCPELMARSYIREGQWAVGGAMSNPGGMLRWFRDNFCQDLVEKAGKENGDVYNLIDEEAMKTPPGAEGIICLPYINGERSPVYDSKVRAVFLGVNFATTRGVIARSIVEGAGYGLRQILELLENSIGEKIHTITVTGGGSKGAFLVQTIADVLGRTLQVKNIPDIGAIGAAMTGAIAANLISIDQNILEKAAAKKYEPNKKLKELYDQGYERYLGIYPAVKGLF